MFDGFELSIAELRVWIADSSAEQLQGWWLKGGRVHNKISSAYKNRVCAAAFDLTAPTNSVVYLDHEAHLRIKDLSASCLGRSSLPGPDCHLRDPDQTAGRGRDGAGFHPGEHRLGALYRVCGVSGVGHAFCGWPKGRGAANGRPLFDYAQSSLLWQFLFRAFDRIFSR